MANFYVYYPPSASGTNPSVGTNGATAPTSSTEIGGVNAGNLVPVSVDSSGNMNVNVVSSTLPSGGATAANQVLEISDLDSIKSSLLTKLAGSFVPKAFDQTVITYVSTTTKIDTVVYKLVGSTVATLTMSYDGSDRLTGVVAS